MKNSKSSCWDPSRATVPLEDYEFADRAEHEAAFAWAEQIGPQPDILTVDLLPPLPYSLDALVAAAALSISKSPWGRFDFIPTARADPRAPWRDPETGLAQRVGDTDYIVVRGVGCLRGWSASLLRASSNSPVTEHLLVEARSGRAVRFDDRSDAACQLQPVVNAGGNLLKKWRWAPPVNVDDVWVPTTAADRIWGSVARISRRGVRCRWLIIDKLNGVEVLRNGITVKDVNGFPEQFVDVASAKRYCKNADERCHSMVGRA